MTSIMPFTRDFGASGSVAILSLPVVDSPSLARWGIGADPSEAKKDRWAAPGDSMTNVRWFTRAVVPGSFLRGTGTRWRVDSKRWASGEGLGLVPGATTGSVRVVVPSSGMQTSLQTSHLL